MLCSTISNVVILATRSLIVWLLVDMDKGCWEFSEVDGWDGFLGRMVIGNTEFPLSLEEDIQ